MIFSTQGQKNPKWFYDFKPFYLKTNLNYDGLSVKDIFK